MIKVPLPRRKTADSLRPLTEKEIQMKLYGNYQEAAAPKETPESRVQLLTPVLKKKKTPSLPFDFNSIKKVILSFPWQKVLSFFTNALGALFDFLKNLLGILISKVSSGWGAGVLVVGVLFLAIQGLNSYRAKAMKTAPPKLQVSSRHPEKHRPGRLPKTPATEQRVERTQKAEPLEETEKIFPPAVLPPAVLEPPPAAPEKSKPYVIQVCTYARQEDAENLVQEMKGNRFPAFFKPFERANGKIFYYVFLGGFENFHEAQGKLEEFKKKPVAKDFADSFVRIL